MEIFEINPYANIFSTSYLLLLLLNIYCVIGFFLYKKTKKDVFKKYNLEPFFIFSLTVFSFCVFFLSKYFHISHAFYFLTFAFTLHFIFYKVKSSSIKKSIVNEEFKQEKLKEIKEKTFSPFFIGLWLFLSVFKFFVIDLYMTPTPSMTPTIKIDHNYALNKVAYGLNIPFSDKLLFQWNTPQRGDIIIFHYNKNNISIPYLKRVVGVEGDTIYFDFKTNTLTVKTKDNTLIEYEYEDADLPSYLADQSIKNKIIKKEINPFNKKDFHYIFNNKKTLYKFIDNDRKVMFSPTEIKPSILKIKVEKDTIFVMGDNRDESYDSRFIGLVKTESVMGKLFGLSYSIYDN